VSIEGVTRDVRGTAWLDHEWSSAYLAADAPGWDWTGVNFDDGGALMAFRIRDRSGGTYWAGGAYRDRAGRMRVLAPSEVRFEPMRQWRSPRTGIEYPVAVRVHAGALVITLEPLFDDQELDSRASVGTIYWEGAVRASIDGRAAGRGYLELTGYGGPLRI
jgi:predicted secreted hydrolase